MRKAAETLRKHAQNFGRLMAQEMGKPIRDGVAEVQKCALGCAFYADNAARFLAHEPVLTEARKSFIAFNPIGVVLAVMPWNFPFWQVFRFAAPSLTAGNAALLKHASNVPGCALAIETVFREAGFPEHLFRTLLISNEQVDAVIEHPLVRAVTLTGSRPAGRAVAGKAGADDDHIHQPSPTPWSRSCRAGRSNDAPEIPPSSNLSGTSVAWLLT